MYYKMINKSNFDDFVAELAKDKEVVGPKEKGVRFAYGKITTPQELRLDFDTTILPPKKYFLPPKQDLLKFDGDTSESCINPKEVVLLGVHPYDIKAISQLDKLFTDGNPDYNYLSNREAATIIGCNVQNVYKTAFFGSIGAGMVTDGFDMFITALPQGYLVEIATPKGEELLSYGSFDDADEDSIKLKDEMIDDTNKKCPYKIEYPIEEVAKKMREHFGDPSWEIMAKNCFSCGSCNLVCPTCYCFDVQDIWNIDQKSGKRYRAWDGCQLPDFATISVQGGKENFRGEPFERYRHRAMRKLVYLNTKLNSPACVGCGRCSIACTSNIANPVNIISRIMEA